jgi:hypothetical protein
MSNGEFLTVVTVAVWSVCLLGTLVLLRKQPVAQGRELYIVLIWWVLLLVPFLIRSRTEFDGFIATVGTWALFLGGVLIGAAMRYVRRSS